MSETGSRGQRLFGMIALSLSMVTKEQLEDCLTIQCDSAIRRRLGAIMLARGYMSDSQVQEVLRVQARVRRRANMPKTKSERRKLLGQILVEHGHVRKETLTAVLRRQQKLRRDGFDFRIGELLLASGEITPGQLKEALAVQNTA